tara:strand:- start:9091 stop:9432 length:342 start_codon:yes stop_codon:yes gene_type:complete
MTQPFYESDVIKEELENMQQLYKDLYDLSVRFPLMKPEEKKEHIVKTLELIAKQKIFYGRLQLMALEDKEAEEVKIRIDQMTEIYSGGKRIEEVLEDMEKRLHSWRRELDAHK